MSEILDLENHQIWNDLEKIFSQIDVNALIESHIDLENFTISDYWDENHVFYEKIISVVPLKAQLESFSLNIIFEDTYTRSLLKFHYLLIADVFEVEKNSERDSNKVIGGITLLYNTNLELEDEYWDIDMSSPFVVGKCRVS
ncbi:hypothetical protein Cylst_4366 [Cylindrospermum stagnale PCC 7417]|uniref:Uncharacterized protein n=1 Tax=Cylindrospermum stagnale PCC 7417 TaxID=56107 RepID=K9X455_9NOST|nr:hypothetical protein [Cylindrospermum stagnale]AFZ26457.1 hypothetical protein Cylst_4366 [Cylindrospermum stagnale PCC 7417]